MTVEEEEEKLSVPPEPISEEQNEFNKLDNKVKLDRLNTLVQRSQVYSQIMAENILKNTMSKKQEKGTDEEQPTNKKRKGNDKGKKNTRDIVSMLSAPSALDSAHKQPKILSGSRLKDYQLDGMEWLITLYENGLNGILADEMGLGKTIQCIAFLCFLIEKGVLGPFLIVAPLSTLSNMQSEINKFAPSVKVLKYVGSKETRNNTRIGSDYNIVITSYEISMKDFSKISRTNWKYLVIDEGHRLKNMNCTLIRVLKKLNVNNKLLLTGTPLQNNLKELWSLLNFILPDIFQDLELFEQWFNFDELTNFLEQSGEESETDKFIKIHVQESLIKNLHTILKPFILRRLKKEVIRNLPPKREYIIHLSLSDLQKKLYNDALNNNLLKGLMEAYLKEYIYFSRDSFLNSKEIESLLEQLYGSQATPAERVKPKLLKEVDSEDEFEQPEVDKHQKSSSHAKMKLPINEQKKVEFLEIYSNCLQVLRSHSMQNTTMQLRNICNSPYIYYDPFYTGDGNENETFFKHLVNKSSKFQILDQLLQYLLPEHKVLIFSQFSSALDLLHDWLNYKKISLCRLDGSMGQEERDEQIKDFVSKDSPQQVFLLSTRAGGLGLNLSAADTVIVFDNDWNPQVDLQAIDRVHRIGQTRLVKVYRFLVRNSIEEILMTKAYSKRFLERVVIQWGGFKFKNFQKLVKDKDTNYKDLISLSRKFVFNGDSDEENDKRLVHYNANDEANENYLTDAEINELTNRSEKRGKGDETFDNISVFDTVDTMGLGLI